MPKLIPVHWKKFEKFLLHIGCQFKRQKGDHLIYNRLGLKRPLVIPKERAIPIFIILNNLRVLGITPDEYLEIIKGIK